MTPDINILVGCDIVEISRIAKIMDNETLLRKTFLPSEMSRFDGEHLAGIFAVKEATIKALGLKTNDWLNIEIKYLESGKPTLSLSKDLNLTDIVSTDCSISHDGGIAFAVVTALQHKNKEII